MVYDRINKWGGAERVLLALHKIFPKAPLYTSVFHPKKAKWAKVFKIKTSFLQKIPFASSHHEFFSPLMFFAFKKFDFKRYDLVISVTSEFAKGIKVSGKTKHICICLTPTRYLWSGYEEYFSNKLVRVITKPLVSILRLLDKKSALEPHSYIAISEEVQKRIKEYYGRESEVVYPPLMISSSKYENKRVKWDCPYFLVVSRLSRFTAYKRVDLAIKAATQLNLTLIIIGEGNQKYFRKFAGTTVKFINNVDDKKLIEHFKNAKALIFPGYEDFGLVMVEAQSLGIPVIAYAKGGALEILKKNTGEFFTKQTVSSLVRALEKFKRKRYNSKIIKENAKRFSFSYFEKALKSHILKFV